MKNLKLKRRLYGGKEALEWYDVCGVVGCQVVPVPTDDLLSKEYAKKRRAQAYHPDKARHPLHPPVHPGMRRVTCTSTLLHATGRCQSATLKLLLSGVGLALFTLACHWSPAQARHGLQKWLAQDHEARAAVLLKLSLSAEVSAEMELFAAQQLAGHAAVVLRFCCILVQTWCGCQGKRCQGETLAGGQLSFTGIACSGGAHGAGQPHAGQRASHRAKRGPAQRRHGAVLRD
jgi:hypothetical protein